MCIIMVQFSDKRHKDTVTISITPYLKKRAQELADLGEFSSISDVFTIALAEFLTNYESRKKAQIQKSELTKPVVIE